jgi:hypothetical protein
MEKKFVVSSSSAKSGAKAVLRSWFLGYSTEEYQTECSGTERYDSKPQTGRECQNTTLVPDFGTFVCTGG